jgi:hypothetical protein
MELRPGSNQRIFDDAGVTRRPSQLRQWRNFRLASRQKSALCGDDK